MLCKIWLIAEHAASLVEFRSLSWEGADEKKEDRRQNRGKT